MIDTGLIYSFADELVKISREEKSRWRRPAGVAAGAALTAGGIALARPGLRRHLGYYAGKLFKPRVAGAATKTSLHPQAVETAKVIAAEIRKKGLDPKKIRIGVGATGGTGKSSLAQALAAELGIPAKELDLVGQSVVKGRDLAKALAKKPLPPGVVAEQSHLLTQTNPDLYDVMVHLQKPIKKIEEQILRRGRGAHQVELYNYPKMEKVIRKGFEATKGEAVHAAPGVRFKIKPEGGWGAEEILRGEAALRGVTGKMTREQMVHAATTGEKPLLGGVLPYIRKGRLLAGAGLVGAGGIGGGALTT